MSSFNSEAIFIKIYLSGHVLSLFAQPLAEFCERLWNTLTTEVASERAFSAMKLLHSNVRNRMTPERVDKQLFIQINYRVLNREPRKPSVIMNASATTYSDSDNDSDYDDIHIEMVPDTAQAPTAAQSVST
jgi:hypothetical protein